MSYIILDNNLMWGRVKRLINKTEDVKGLTGTTPLEIAKEVIYYSFARKAGSLDSIPNIVEISNETAVFILQKAALEERDLGKAEFYGPGEKKAETDPEPNRILEDIETCKELYRVIKEQHLSGKKECDKEFDSRIKSLNTIDLSFHSRLGDRIGEKDDELFDDACFITEAVSLLESDEDLRNDFIKSKTADGELLAYHLNEQSYCVDRLEELLGVKKIEKKDLYKTEEPTISFYKAYGVENEIRYIVNKIIKEKIPFGDVNIFYSSDKYEGYIKSVLGREGIPYSFVTGRTPSDRYITLFKNIITFASNDFMYADYRTICRSYLMSNICFGINLQDDCEIGWGRHPYLAKAKMKKKELEEDRIRIEAGTDWYEGLSDEDKKDKLEKNNNKKQYYEMMETLVGIFSEESTTLQELYTSIVDFLKNYTNRHNLERGKGLAALKDRLPQMAIISDQLGEIEMEKALSVLSDFADGIMFHDAEDAGSVTVEKMGKVSISDRTKSFFVGLSYSDFYSKSSESPVMTDEEMELLFIKPLIISKDVNEKKEENVKKTIQEMNGKVYLSYSYFDTQRILENSPADIYLDYLDTYKNKPAASGNSSDIEEVIGFDELGTEDMKFQDIDYVAEVEAIKEAAKQAKAAEESEEIVTDDDEDSDGIDSREEDEEDGYDEEDEEDEYDEEDEVIIERYLSASKIQNIINCSRAFKYQNDLYLPGESEIDVDSKEWMSVSLKGTYIHEILQRYFEEIIIDDDGSIKPDYDESIYKKVEEELYEKYIKQYPYWNLDVVKDCRETYNKGIELYLKKTHEDFKNNGWKVFCTEGRFRFYGLLESDVEESFDDFDELRVYLTGIMDRVDYREEDGQRYYRIVDYKSGRKKTQAEKLEKQKLIQHDLYMRVLKHLATNDGTIKSSGKDNETKVPDGNCELAEYHFPFEEKEDDQVLVCGLDDSLYDHMIEKINVYFSQDYDDDGFATINEIDTKNDDRCKYCDYINICRTAKR